MSGKFRQGFTSLEQELEAGTVPVRGTIPEWLNGVLLRNGPALFEVGGQSFRHWFDGQAMLHKFTFQDGRVSYANKFIRSPGYEQARQTGKISCSEFATDPCRAIFQRVAAGFSAQTASHNANINVAKMANQFVAVGEWPLPIIFDKETLATAGVVDFQDNFEFGASTAHPHYDPGRCAAVNQLVQYGRQSSYNIFYIPDDKWERQLIASVPVQEPGYIHSFGLTENHVILAEFPLVVNPLRLIKGGRPFIENFEWKPAQGSRFFVLRKSDGKLVGKHESAPFFAFHHVNAFEKEGEIVVDICAYKDASPIDELYLATLEGTAGGRLSFSELRRYHLVAGSRSATYELLSGEMVELPRIHYDEYNGRSYRYVYGVSCCKNQPGDFYNQLVKVDVRDGRTAVWHEKDCYPGELVFVPRPGAGAEDDGVLLSVVLNAHENNSFLMVFNAVSFQEMGRATIPHHVPFGFHGEYFA